MLFRSLARPAPPSSGREPPRFLPPKSDVRRDGGAVDAVDAGKLTDAPAGFVVGDQRLHLVREQAPLDAAQLADVRTPRILTKAALGRVNRRVLAFLAEPDVTT